MAMKPATGTAATRRRGARRRTSSLSAGVAC
jgi:hypothetical protein